MKLNLENVSSNDLVSDITFLIFIINCDPYKVCQSLIPTSCAFNYETLQVIFSSISYILLNLIILKPFAQLSIFWKKNERIAYLDMTECVTRERESVQQTVVVTNLGKREYIKVSMTILVYMLMCVCMYFSHEMVFTHGGRNTSKKLGISVLSSENGTAIKMWHYQSSE